MVSCSTPDIAECLDYPEHSNNQKKVKAVVSEVKVEIGHDGTVIDQPPSSFHVTFSSEEIAKQKTDLVSELSRPAENSESSQNVDPSTDLVQRRDQTLGKTVEQSDFHNRRKHRLSVRYLPNVQQMIQRYEKPVANVPPPSVSSTVPVKPSVRCQTKTNESSESLVARQAKHYMSLDRSARLEIHFEPRQGSNGRTCDNRKQTDQREHPLLSSSSSNSSIISSASLYVGMVDISPIESTGDLQSNSCRVTPGWPFCPKNSCRIG